MHRAEIEKITQANLQAYIYDNENADERKLVLSKKELFGVPTALIANQLSGRRKAKTKLPTWYGAKGIVYPPSVNIEQSSSEATAKYKCEIIKRTIVERLAVADLTGGFGVDSFFFSTIFERVNYVESNRELVEIARNNHTILRAASQQFPIDHSLSRAEDFLNNTAAKFDFIYLDPSRRDQNDKKTFLLKDTQPNVVALLPLLFSKSDFVLIKTSPLLDIQSALLELKSVQAVYIVSVDNECKELLFLLNEKHIGAPIIEAVDLLRTGNLKSTFSFSIKEESESECFYSDPLTFMYEPNAAILKSGAFRLLAERYKFFKLSKSTHFYTSEELVKDFPGRIFKSEKINPTLKELEQYLPKRQANVTTRNYPLSPDELKKKLKLKDGGDKFIIGCSGEREKFILLASKVFSS
jgi:hypothetical protein